MCIRHVEYIFSIDKVIPVDVLRVFLVDTITMLFIQVCFCRSHTFPCRSLLLSATVLYVTNPLQTSDITQTRRKGSLACDVTKHAMI